MSGPVTVSGLICVDAINEKRVVIIVSNLAHILRQNGWIISYGNEKELFTGLDMTIATPSC